MMNFCRGVFALFRREVKESFSSPLLFVLAGIFNFIMGWIFYSYLVHSKEYTTATLTDVVIRPIYGNINFLFLILVPLITMRSFAEERKQHTLELLLLSRLSHSQIILGKFFSSLLSSLFILSFTILFPIILSFSGYSDWGTVLTCYIGLLLCISFYTMVGIFASSLTENQIIAAVIGFSILFAMILLMVSAASTNNLIVAQILKYISSSTHFEGFVRGAMKSYNFIYFASGLGFFFYLTERSVDSRNW